MKPIFPYGDVQVQIAEKIETMNSDQWKKAAKRTKIRCEETEIWRVPPALQEIKEREVA